MRRMPRHLLLPSFVLGLAATLAAPEGHAADAPPGTQRCRLAGVETDAWCGVLKRPLDPAQPQGRQIDLHFAVLPARARNKLPDPVFFFAGGPGQSAISLAGSVGPLMSRVLNRRDVVLIDQRGTGRSAPLKCEDDLPTRPLADLGDSDRQFTEIERCRQKLEALPHGDLRLYTTVIAMQDADAVRQALGAKQVNVVGGSYGTRAGLDYLRQFPQSVRRAVLDGAAPPDMVLPASFSPDSQTAFEAMLRACEADKACQGRYPNLRADWQAVLKSLPRELNIIHPVTGQPETLTLGRDGLLSMARAPLYAPALASALPLAVTEAARGRFQALMGLSASLGGRPSHALAMGMHFSVICAEDMPRLQDAATAEAPSVDFGETFSRIYTRVCATWPRGAVPAAFYTMPPAPAATLVLSGGADPATPPRHGERVAKALGAKARHVVVPEAGHGVMGIGCMRDVIFRFIDAADDEAAAKVDADCARSIPRPGAYLPPLPASPGARP
jgi:pimeloyl-ACP methyl ester carboxylesterase